MLTKYKTSLHRYLKGLKAIGYAIASPSILKKTINYLYTESALKKSSLKQKNLTEITDIHKTIKLQNFIARDGNVSYFELMAIASIIATHKPKHLLEIGTFDGNTTVQMALNSPLDAVIHTIDLPLENSATTIPSLKNDLKFIHDQDKQIKKYRGVERTITQHFGDSTTYDFNEFGLIEFCFIDGGHSYECVKSDTEKTLKILAPNGVIVWHDFTPNWPGIYRYLNELSQTLPLIHISETNLAIYVH